MNKSTRYLVVLMTMQILLCFCLTIVNAQEQECCMRKTYNSKLNVFTGTISHPEIDQDYLEHTDIQDLIDYFMLKANR